MAKQAEPATLSNAIRQQLRRDILSGQWSPGEKLRLASLSDRYQTSSTVIREALTRLTGDKLIDLKPNRGFFIPTLSLKELHDFNELRCLTEEFGITLAIQRGDLEWESRVFAAHHTLERTPQYLDESSGLISPDWTQAHHAFHLELLSACELPVLVELSGVLADRHALYRRWANPTGASRLRAIQLEHNKILKAVLNHDAELAGSLLREHFTNSMKLILKAGLQPEAAPSED